MATTFLIYALAGIVGGLLAGLFGIGGGLIIVPMLVFCFQFQGISPDVIMHLALGTSLATIIFTAISSSLSHHKRGAVDWTVLKRIVFGILTGTYLGSYFASLMNTSLLKGIFVVFLYYVCFQMFLNKKPKPSRELPGAVGMFSAGNVIGIISSLVGIGGGTVSVPFLVWHNMPLHKAIGTASAIGFPIAIAGAVGYMVNGWSDPDLPSMALGYVYLPALIGIVCLSVLTAPIGAKLAHSLPTAKLKRFFAVLLLIVATKMLIGLF